jgi:ubiquinone/menaquinone biosynthesis C-methylase UbiE
MQDWRRYDDVADTYERVHAARFADPARDLVTLTGIRDGERVLDVGTGTGVAGEAARSAGAFVVGIDPSLEMLRIARTDRPGVHVAAAQAIDLPLRDQAFDAVIGNFVLAHFTKYQTALFDLIRVAKPEGRIGLSAWADPQDDLTKTWLELVYEVVPREMLEPALSQAVPWRDRFRNRGAIEEALIDAGLRHVRTEVDQYRFQYSLDDYVDGLATWATGRFVRSMLGDAGFAAFLERVRTTFKERFADPVNDFREVMFALGVKP